MKIVSNGLCHYIL